jgi:GNAT superfamily N-acetyltransferase
MAVMRTGRPQRPEGPFPARPEDAAALNQVFSDAFTERYRRDGLVGVRVPFLNPVIWRFAIEDADGGALLWRDDSGEIAAFNVAHASGQEGWMGPLAVRPDLQAGGLGKAVVTAASDWLSRAGCSTIGLETMPRTMDNIGFYSALGYVPGKLTVTVTLDAAPAARSPLLLGRLGAGAQDDAVAECRALTESLIPGWDYSRELRLTEELAIGQTLLLRDGETLVGFALCHTVPLVEGRALDEMRVLKLVLASDAVLPAAISGLTDLARRHHARRVAMRAQTEYSAAYARLISAGGRVRWTDLRMTLAGHAEPKAARGLIWSNWEI